MGTRQSRSLSKKTRIFTALIVSPSHISGTYEARVVKFGMQASFISYFVVYYCTILIIIIIISNVSLGIVLLQWQEFATRSLAVFSWHATAVSVPVANIGWCQG